ncbi:synaptic defective enhancer 1-like [Aphis gossypii]|uniref:synaptic defective enhancer 1-like n=1 Tax=Aphis gossypii TaxID=80765 RepID=UPI00215963A7|nr:synaptic defective enhancer 1-like [Aphis gossypii]
MHGPTSTAVACALWLACVTPLLVADAAAPVARRPHDRRVRPAGSTVAAADGYVAAEPAANAATAGDDYDAYDEEYEDSGDSRKRPPPPPPPPPPTTTTSPPDRRESMNKSSSDSYSPTSLPPIQPPYDVQPTEPDQPEQYPEGL